MYSVFLVFLLVWVAGMFSPANASKAKMYKWTDEHGQVHYTQSPPAGQPAEEVKPPPPVDTEKALKVLEEQKKRAESLHEERLKKAEESEKAKQQQAESKSKCAAAQKELEGLTQSQRVFERDTQGYPKRISEEQRQEAIARARQQLSEFCK